MADLSDVIKRLQDLPAAIEDALGFEVWQVAHSEIVDTAMDNVYEYPAMPYFMNSRRFYAGGLLDPDNYERTTETVGDEIIFRAKNVTPLQNLWSDTHDEPLIDVIESGDRRYYQPYPRPFMKQSEDKIMNSQAVKDALANGLKRQGYDLV